MLIVSRLWFFYLFLRYSFATVLKCYKCKSESKVKAGFTRGLQRYKCKNCGCYFSVEKKSTVKSEEQKRMALAMYLEGLGFRTIGRILKISYGTVYQWIKKWGDMVALPKNKAPIEIVELDEMHSYIGLKKTTVGYGLLLIDLRKGLSLLCVEQEERKQE